MFTFEELHNKINERTTGRSAWSKGVAAYAHDLARDLAEAVENGNITLEELQSDGIKRKLVLLSGAKDWKQFSNTGCSLWSNEAIAHRLCTPSQLKKYNKGAKDPNSHETWLDVQAHALYQAYNLMCSAICAIS